MIGSPQTNLEALLEELLLEGRFEDAQTKYPDAAEELAQLKAAGVNSKYAQWFGKQWSQLKSDGSPKSDLSMEAVVNLFTSYDQLLRKKQIPEPRNRDINAFSTWDQWESLVHDLTERKEKKEEEKAKASDADVVYKDSRYLIVHPNTMQASCKYGKSTEWCISATEEGKNYFEGYKKQGADFFFIIDRKTDDKDALTTFPGQQDRAPEVFDANDTQYDFTYLLEKYPETLHDTLYNLAYGEEKAKQLKTLLKNPLETIMQLEPSEDVIRKFYQNVVSPLGDGTAAQLLSQALKNLSPENVPMQVIQFTDWVGWSFDDESVSLPTLWDLYEASKKFLGNENIAWGGDLVGLDVFSRIVHRPFKSAEEFIRLMREANFLADKFYDSEHSGFVIGILSNLVDSNRRKENRTVVFEAAQLDPGTFTNFMLHVFDTWPDWAKSRSYSAWVGDYIAGKYGMSHELASGFVYMLPNLWEAFGELNMNSLKKILPSMLAASTRHRATSEVVKSQASEHVDLLIQLLQSSQGIRNRLIDEKLAAAYNESVKLRAAQLLREDMKRFFPGLIRD